MTKRVSAVSGVLRQEFADCSLAVLKWKTLSSDSSYAQFAGKISYRRTNSEYDRFAAVPLQTCTVTIRDLTRTVHSVEVTAETLYEAVAQALAALRSQAWVGDIGQGLTTATVTVRHPEITHTVKIQDFENWLKSGVRSPADMLLKARLRRLLGGIDP